VVHSKNSIRAKIRPTAFVETCGTSKPLAYQSPGRHRLALRVGSRLLRAAKILLTPHLNSERWSEAKCRKVEHRFFGNIWG
jgi:hypothetical protein